MLEYAMKERAAFIVAMTAIRYKREIKPLQRFEIHTQLIASDDKWMTLAHEFRAPDTGDPLAVALCRAVLKQHGGTCSPRALLRAVGLDLDLCPKPRAELKAALQSCEALDAALRDAARSQPAAPRPADR